MLADDLIYNVVFTITRAVDDPHTRPCVFHWNPVEDGCSQSGMILLYHGDESVEFREAELPTKLLIPQKVTASDPYFKELVPGNSVSWKAPLPAVYFKNCGPKVAYLLLWPGGQIPLWEWGTLAEHSEHTYSQIPPGNTSRSLIPVICDTQLRERP